MEKRKLFPLQGFELRPLGLPAHSQSLYRLHYSDSKIKGKGKVALEAKRQTKLNHTHK
jgi:hypothetical protein